MTGKGTTMRLRSIALALATTGVALSGCAGYAGNSGNPTAPSGNPAVPSNAIVIDIVAENGAQSFSPNPSSNPDGRIAVWHNLDRVTHRVVLNDRSVDTGNLAPGMYSPPMTLTTVGGYHCSIHPDMVGTVTR